MNESIATPTTLSVFGFPDRGASYHSLAVARVFVAWGGISYATGGLLAVPVLNQITRGSLPPHALAVVSQAMHQSISLLGGSFKVGIICVGLALATLGIGGWILEPGLRNRSAIGEPGGRRPPVVLRALGHFDAIRTSCLGILLVLLPSLARGFADVEFARYLWGQGVFTILSCVMVGIVYMAATAGAATFPAVARVFYAYVGATILSVCVLSTLLPGAWPINLLFGLSLPSPGLLVFGLHLSHHIGEEQAQAQTSAESRLREEARKDERERRTYEEQREERRSQRIRERQNAENLARQASLDERRSLLSFLNGGS